MGAAVLTNCGAFFYALSFPIMLLAYYILVRSTTSVLQGITGFGAAVIASPLLLLVFDKTTAVTSLIISSIALNAFLLILIGKRGTIHWKLFSLLVGASLVGMPVGLWVLQAANVHLLQIGAGFLCVIFCILFYLRLTPRSHSSSMAGFAGLIAGVLQTSIGMAGPPVALILIGRDSEKNEMRKTLAAYFLVINIIAVALYAYTGTLTVGSWSFGFYGTLAVLVGAYIGHRLAHKISRETFILLTLGIILVTGLSAIYSGFFGS